jgi:hypothetical protein
MRIAVMLLVFAVATRTPAVALSPQVSDCYSATKGDAALLLVRARSLVSDSSGTQIRAHLGVTPWNPDSVTIVTDSTTCANLRQKVIAAAPGLGLIRASWPLFVAARVGPYSYFVDSAVGDQGMRWHFHVRADSNIVTYVGLR